MKKSRMMELKDEFLLNEKFDEKSLKTQEHYEHVVNMFVDFIKSDEVTKIEIMKFKEYLIDNFKPSTINNYIIITNKFIKYCEIIEKHGEFKLEKLKKWESNNTLKLVRIQNKQSLADVLEPEDLKRMLRMAKSKKVNRMDMYLIMKIFAYTGIRAHELSAFTVENIQKNYINVKNKGKIRTIILRNDIKKELNEYCREKKIESGYIFYGKSKDKMIDQSTIYKNLKKIAGKCRGIKIEKVHPHSFRHLFAIKFLEEGGDVTELADILGHSSVDTTRIYTRTTDKMKKKRLERMKY